MAIITPPVPEERDVPSLVNAYIISQPEAKCRDMMELHRAILDVMPGCKLWFLDGKDSENKTVSNPILDMDFKP